MTISTTDRLVIYQGNGSATEFPFNFLIPTGTLSVSLQDHATNVITEVLTPGDYSVVGIDDPDGGTVTYSSGGGPIDADVNIIVLRTMPYTQDLNISPYGGFDPTVVEKQLDYIVMQIQQIAEAQSRSLIVNPGQTPPSLVEILAAESYAAQAEAARDAAQAAEVNAVAAETLAEAWATNPEDDEVQPGLFSAFHWYRKTLALYNSVVAGLAAAIHAAAAKTPLVDADELGIADSAASWALKKVTWLSLKLGVFVQPVVAIARAATTDLGAATSFFLSLTGTTTITSLGTADAGTLRLVQFAGAGTLTNNANIILPTAANITTAANDFALFRSEGAGVWRCVWYRGALVTADWTTGTKTTPGMPTPAQVAAAVAAFSGWTELAPVVTTSGTSVDVTGIPTTARDIEIWFDDVSTSGTDHLLVQIGTGSTPTTSGYSSGSGIIGAAFRTFSTAGFIIYNNLTTGQAFGCMRLHKTTGNNWVATHVVTQDMATGNGSGGGGSVSIGAAIGMIRLRTPTGTPTFDNGSIQVRYKS